MPAVAAADRFRNSRRVDMIRMHASRADARLKPSRYAELETRRAVNDPTYLTHPTYPTYLTHPTRLTHPTYLTHPTRPNHLLEPAQPTARVCAGDARDRPRARPSRPRQPCGCCRCRPADRR